MNPRIDLNKHLTSPLGKAMLTFSGEAHKHLDPKLFGLVQIRASQINGCAYCIDMHTKDARQAGETEQRIYGLSAWREAPYYSERERAALEYTEALTLISKDQVPDDVYQRASAHFNEEELLALTFGVIVINSWNRLAITFRSPAGTYQPRALAGASH